MHDQPPSEAMIKQIPLKVVLLLLSGLQVPCVEGQVSLEQVKDIYNKYKVRSYGDATYYGDYPGGGACSLDPLSPIAGQRGLMRTAAGIPHYQNSLGCGMCLEVTGSGIGTGDSPIRGKKRVIVHDRCLAGLDLFVKGDGRWKISFIAIPCPTVPGKAGNIQFRFEGSNPWYIKLQVRNTKIQVAGLEIRKKGKYRCLKRSNDNFFVSMGVGLGKVEVPLHVRLTSVSGEQVKSIIPSVRNDFSYPSNVQFSSINAGDGPDQIKCFGQGMQAPYPSNGAN